MEAIEAELEAELAAIGNITTSYDAAGLDDDSLSSEGSQDQDANPLSSLGGFDKFILCVQEANEVKDRALVVVAESKLILENDRHETNDAGTRRLNDEDASGGCNDEDPGSTSIDTDESDVASAQTSVVPAPPSLPPPATSDEVSDESDVPSISAHEPATAAVYKSSTSNIRSSSSPSSSSLSQAQFNGVAPNLVSAPLSPPPNIESPLQSSEYDHELRAIEQEALEAEVARQERSRRAQILRETVHAEATKMFEQQTGAAIAIEAMARRTIAKQRVKRMRRALQVEAHLISVRNHISLRRTMSTMQSFSSELRREAFYSTRTRLQLHLNDRRERYNASAVIIQCCFRRSIALRSAMRIRETVFLLQRFIRCKQSQKSFYRLRSSAIIVQRCLSARAAKKEAAARKIEESVMCIQRVARGFVARRGLRCAMECIITLQRYYRGQRARGQLTAIQCSSFAFDDDSEINVEDLIGGIGELDDEPDDAFLESRQPPRRREETVDVAVASNIGTSTPDTNQIATNGMGPSTPLAIESQPSPSAPSTQLVRTDTASLPSTTTTGTARGWGARVARAFSERGQNMLPGTRRRKNNYRSRREGQRRWR